MIQSKHQSGQWSTYMLERKRKTSATCTEAFPDDESIEHCPDFICKILAFSFIKLFFFLFVNHMQIISLNCPVLHALSMISCRFGVNISLFSVSFQVDIPLFSLIVPGYHQGSFILFPTYISLLEHNQLTHP